MENLENSRAGGLEHATLSEADPRQWLLASLGDYELRFPEEAGIVTRFRELVIAHEDCFDRCCLPGHITGSSLLLDPSGERTLLTHHRKLGRWLQLGGHSDGNPDTLAVALQEAEEESGLRVVPLRRAILDLDIHPIPARGAEAAHEHFDARFVLQAVGSDGFQVSAESHDLAWVPLDELERYTRETSVLRLREKWRAWAA